MKVSEESFEYYRGLSRVLISNKTGNIRGPQGSNGASPTKREKHHFLCETCCYNFADSAPTIFFISIGSPLGCSTTITTCHFPTGDALSVDV